MNITSDPNPGGLGLTATRGTPRGGASAARAEGAFELRFDSLFQAGRALSFPCDGRGQVNLDHLSERARCNYFFARAVVGRDFAHPAVVMRPHSGATSWMN
jgi:hypothetical protein